MNLLGEPTLWYDEMNYVEEKYWIYFLKLKISLTSKWKRKKKNFQLKRVQDERFDTNTSSIISVLFLWEKLLSSPANVNLTLIELWVKV